MVPSPSTPRDPARPVRWLDDDEQCAWRAFLAATQLLMDQLDRELQAGVGIPHAYYEILVRLSEAPGRAMRMSDLADRCQSSRSRLSHAAARLEERGWVRRETVPSDRRGDRPPAAGGTAAGACRPRAAPGATAGSSPRPTAPRP